MGTPSQEMRSPARAGLLSLLGLAVLGLGYWYTSGALDRPPTKASRAQLMELPSSEGAQPEAPGSAWVVQGDRAQLQGEIMGTTYAVTVRGLDPAQGVSLAAGVVGALEKVDTLMSTYKPDSELSRFNAGGAEGLEISQEVVDVLMISRVVYRASGGAFDPSVGPLVRAWGFGPDKSPDKAPEDLEERLALIGFDKIKWRKATAGGAAHLLKSDPAQELDLSAVAKGYAADQVCAVLAAAGLRHYMVEVGGELCVAGLGGPDRPWTVGVERPTAGRGGLQRAIALGPEMQPVGMATSGDYRNYREIDGKRVSHTIDPRTGAPVTHNLASVTVLAASSAQADAWATALSVLGPQAGFELATSSGIAAYFIVREREGFTQRDTPAFATLVDATWAEPLARPQDPPESK